MAPASKVGTGGEVAGSPPSSHVKSVLAISAPGSRMHAPASAEQRDLVTVSVGVPGFSSVATTSNSNSRPSRWTGASPIFLTAVEVRPPAVVCST